MSKIVQFYMLITTRIYVHIEILQYLIKLLEIKPNDENDSI